MGMRIPEQAVKEILDKARIEEIVSNYVSLTRKGDRLWGLSPFKPEKTPSFSVSPERNAYYCFSTGKGGGAVNFVMEMEHLNYAEALHFLARKFGIEITAESAELSEEYKQKKALGELYQRLVPSLQHLLTASPEGKIALDYIRSRGIEEAVFKRFRLGYLPSGEWLWNFLSGKKYTPDFLAASGLFSRNHPRFSIFSGRLIFPISDISGSVIAFGGRILGDAKGPKYINSPETSLYHKSSTVFGIDLAKDSIKQQGKAILCEGYMDVIALHQAGIGHAVAPLGTAFTPEQAKLLRRLAGGVSLLFDNDEAGRTATEKALITCENAELDCDVIQAGDQKDPADILLKDGSHALQKMVDCKVNAFEYLMEQFRKADSLKNPEGVSRFVQRLKPVLASIQSPVKQDGMLRLVADNLGLSTEILRKELDRGSVKPDLSKPAARLVEKKNPERSGNGTHLLELRIMLAVGLNSGLFPFLRMSLRLEDLKDVQARELYISLEECFRDESMDLSSLLGKIQDEPLKALLQKKQVEGEFSNKPESFVKIGILRIRERNLVERRSALTQELRKLSHVSDPDPRLERELLEETLIIDEAVKELRKQIDDRSAE